MTNELSPKSRLVALALAVPLGAFGAHRFYAGKVRSGIIQACTLGGLGLWWLYDIILILGGGFTDLEGRRIVRWETEDEIATRLGPASVSEEILQELDALRAEVAELSERVDFTERLIAAPRQPGEPTSPSA